MHDDLPTYMSSLSWADLLNQLNINETLRTRLGVSLCPFTGLVEEYTLADRLGGMLNIWPTKWREVIDVERAAAT